MPDGRTHSQTLKDSATQLLIKYQSGALVTQCDFSINAFEKNRFLTDFDEVIAKHRFSSTQLKLTNDLNNPQRDATRDKLT